MTPNRLSRFLVLATLVALAMGRPGVAAAAAKVHLTFAMWSDSGPAEIDAQKALLQKYMAANPNVEIELYTHGWVGYHPQLLAMAAGEVTPDVMVIQRTYLPGFVEQGIVQPIDPWLAKESPEFRRDIVELVSGTYKNKVYGIPIWGGPSLVEYNADMFEEAGIPQPIDLAKRNAWTWDVFVEFGRKITRDLNGDGVIDRYMLPQLSTSEQDWYVKFRTFGADVVTADGRPFTNMDAIQKALDFWSGLSLKQHIAPPGSRGTVDVDSFLKGRQTAVAYTWVSGIPNHFQMVNRTFRFEVTTPPAGPNGEFALVGGCPVAISAKTPYAQEAYRFARWYAMESGAWKLRGFPSSWNDLRDEYRSHLATMISWPEAVMKAMSGPISMEPGIGIHRDDLKRGWYETLNLLAKGTISPYEAATRIVEHTRKVLSGQ